MRDSRKGICIGICFIGRFERSLIMLFEFGLRGLSWAGFYRGDLRWVRLLWLEGI